MQGYKYTFTFSGNARVLRDPLPVTWDRRKAVGRARDTAKSPERRDANLRSFEPIVLLDWKCKKLFTNLVAFRVHQGSARVATAHSARGGVDAYLESSSSTTRLYHSSNLSFTFVVQSISLPKTASASASDITGLETS